MNIKDQFADYGQSLKNWILKDWPKESPQDISIGVWGTVGSGKTTYLTMLYEALVLSEDWEVSVNSAGHRFIRNHITTIQSNHLFPEATMPSNELEIFSFTLKPQFKSRHDGKVVLNFVDAPGEFYEFYNHRLNAQLVIKNDSSDTQSQNLMDIIDYLISCDGIVFLLDPDRTKEAGDDYAILIEDLILEFQDRSKDSNLDTERLQQYMAFCVTKVDQENLWKRVSAPTQLVKEIVGHRLFEKLARNYCYVDAKDPGKNRFAFFAISSIGLYQDKDGSWKTPVIEPKEVPSERHTYEYGVGESTYADSDTSSTYVFPLTIEERLNNSKTDSSEAASVCSLPTLQKGVDYRPFQVIDPIAWLVTSIQNDPPVRTRIL